MTNFHHPTQVRPKNKKVKHNDWICEICSNYNYSFRVQCNFNLIQVTAVKHNQQKQSTKSKPNKKSNKFCQVKSNNHRQQSAQIKQIIFQILYF